MGDDKNGFSFSGHSKVFDYSGKELFSANKNKEEVFQIKVSIDNLKINRSKMNFLEDIDSFTLQ